MKSETLVYRYREDASVSKCISKCFFLADKRQRLKCCLLYLFVIKYSNNNNNNNNKKKCLSVMETDIYSKR